MRAGRMARTALYAGPAMHPPHRSATCALALATWLLWTAAWLLWTSDARAHASHEHAAAGATGEIAQAADGPIEAIWRVQRFDFIYRSTDVYYACHVLPLKIGAILTALGAHDRVVVDIDCMGRAFVNRAHARVTLATPIAATPANLRVATTFDARTRLLARVRKIELPAAADVERFPASWRTISLGSRSDPRLEAGDCDLLRALREQIFPKLPIRMAREGLRCVAGGSTRIRPRLEATALMPTREAPGAYGMR